MTKAISVSAQREGFHRWLGAPDEVKFLSKWHRHLFKIQVFVEISKNRGIEFFTLLKDINSLIDLWISKSDYPMIDGFSWEEFYLETGQGIDQDILVIDSCESFAEWLLLGIRDKYKACVVVEVSEDGENAGIANNCN